MRYLLLISVHSTYFIVKSGDAVNVDGGDFTDENEIVKKQKEPADKMIKRAKAKPKAQEDHKVYEFEPDVNW